MGGWTILTMDEPSGPFSSGGAIVGGVAEASSREDHCHATAERREQDGKRRGRSLHEAMRRVIAKGPAVERGMDGNPD